MKMVRGRYTTMNLLSKLALVPFIAFFTMMVTVASIGKDGIKAMPWLFPDGNALYVFYAWIVILTILVPIQHYTKKKKDD